MLKLSPKKAHNNELINRHLHINMTGYNPGLPIDQGDQLEASLAYGMGIYANRLLPIDCTLTA